jgi:hypothetical protein
MSRRPGWLLEELRLEWWRALAVAQERLAKPGPYPAWLAMDEAQRAIKMLELTAEASRRAAQ